MIIILVYLLLLLMWFFVYFLVWFLWKCFLGICFFLFKVVFELVVCNVFFFIIVYFGLDLLLELLRGVLLLLFLLFILFFLNREFFWFKLLRLF